MDSISHLHTPIIPSSSHSTPGATGTPSSPAANSNSPHHSLNPNHPSSSSSQSQAQAPFALDAFDFSSQDFTLPSNMDELNLFTHQQTGTTSGGSGSHSNVDSPSNHSQKFDDLSSQQLQSIIQSAMASANNTTSSNSSNSPSQSHPSPISHSSHSNNLKINTGQQGGNGNNLTIQDLHRILMEKEQSERMQNMQTQVLRQQLETLQQMSKHQVESSNNNNNGFLNQHSGNHSNNYLPYFGKDQQQHQGSSNSTPGGTHHSSPNHPSYQKGSSPPTSSNNNYQNHGLPIPSSGAPASVIAQYGLMTPMGSGAFGNSVFNNGHGAPTNGQPPFVSPLDMPHGHGNEMDGHHMNHQPWRGQDESAFSPLESPAMTPASVFSNMSRGGGAEHLFFSPLTSPALRPQPPSAGEMMLNQAHYSHDGSQMQHHHHGGGGPYDPPLPSPQFRGQAGQSTTPAASPLALMGKPGPTTRRNRSSTAEARANKIRPSPLVKPQSGRGKKRDSNGLPSPSTSMNQSSTPDSRRQSFGEASGSGTERSRSRSSSNNNHPHQTSISAFSSNFDSNTRMDASPSEGAVSTPSPIDLSGSMIMPPPAAPNNKPMTPGSIMGIRSGNGNTRQSSNLVPSKSEPTSSGTRTTRAKASASNMSNGAASSSSSSNNAPQPQPILKKPAIYTGGPAGPRAQAGGGRGKRAAKAAAAAVNFANPGMTPAEREAWLNKMAGTDGDSRKTSHKAAEQKRRDSLKFCFDELRTLLPAIILDETSPGGSALGADGREVDMNPENFRMEDTLDKEPGSESAKTANKGISKVALLRHSNEYIIRLKMRLNRRDQDIEHLINQIKSLKRELGRSEDEEDSSGGDGDEEFDGNGQMNHHHHGMSIDHGRELGFDMDVS